MTSVHSPLVRLKYGTHGVFECKMDDERVVAVHAAPAGTERVASELGTALAHPIEFPPFEQAIVPGDRVVIALDRETPHAAEVVGALWEIARGRDVAARDFCVAEPLGDGSGANGTLLSAIPEDVRDDIRRVTHVGDDRKQHRYLATVGSGERVYLARELVDADLVVTVGCVEFDSLIGYRGTNSVLFPGFTTAEAWRKSRGRGHVELGPDDERPLRQLADEVGWLLGTQFTVQMIPAAGAGAARVLAGENEGVLRLAKHYLNESWRIELGERAEAVVAAVDADAGGHGWAQVARAAAAARNVVERGGKIVLLTELDAEFGEGLRLLAAMDEPGDALKPLRESAPDDLEAASQLAAAADWADVYLLSRLPPDDVEDCFLVPLATEDEVERVLASVSRCVFLESAQHVYASVTD